MNTGYCIWACVLGPGSRLQFDVELSMGVDPKFSAKESLELTEHRVQVSFLFFCSMRTFFDYVLYGHCIVLCIKYLDSIACWVVPIHAVQFF